jgi:hypothetical protein
LTSTCTFRGLAAAELAGELVGHHHAEIETAVGDGALERRRRGIGAGEPQGAVLGDRRDELATLRRAALIHDADAQVLHLRVQDEAEHQELDHRRDDQR